MVVAPTTRSERIGLEMDEVAGMPQMQKANLLRAGPNTAIDEIDVRLIRLLQSDGRMSFVALANDLQLAEKTVRKRIADLRSTGCMDITVVTDPRSIGYHSIAMVGVKVDQGTSRNELAERLFELEVVDYAVTALGAYDILVELVCHDDSELATQIDNGLRKIAGIRDLEVFPYLRLHYQQPAWDRAQDKPNKGNVPPKYNLDPVDLSIIRLLSEDGRKPFLEIARLLEVSESQIRNRYSRLVDDGTLQVLAITNPKILGYALSAWVSVRVSANRSITEVADILAGFSSVAYLAICAGRYDIMMEVICVDRDDLYALLDNKIRKVDGISSIETFICSDFLYRKLVMPRTQK